MPYFDLKEVRSLALRTHNNSYHFKKGIPLEVTNAEDVDRFRNETPLFETDENGVALVNVNKGTITSRGFRKFKSENAIDAEEVLKDVYAEAVAARESKPVDVNALLNEVNEELNAAKVSTEEVSSEEVPSEEKQENNELPEGEQLENLQVEVVQEAPKKKKKKASNECGKCSRVFDSKAELELHLEDHDAEE